ncbi:MAG: hypothetical protein HQL41_08995 [Alphaproteobacteria bacterium]|nr:hypothetical protein [Alphaproteobacteria bacterium]
MASYSEAELAALRKAYASGALMVRYGDKQITYGSSHDLRTRITELETAINGRRPVKQVRIVTSKGF